MINGNKVMSCKICNGEDISVIYKGPIRDGVFGSIVERSQINKCNTCGISRVDECDSFEQKNYESSTYREEMGQELSVDDFFSHADPIQIHHLDAFWPFSFRNKVVADVGCGAGSFIDHIAGLASEVIAIEPTKMYHDSLSDRGYKVFSYANEAKTKFNNGVDIIVSFQVIEHVENPIEFLKEIYSLVKKGGKLIIATPNHDDILMKLLPKSFPSFFYRRAHRWYFDEESLSYCLEQSGFKNIDVRYKHTFGISNALAWLRDKKPQRNIELYGIGPSADVFWKDYLETSKQADTLFAMAEK
jgi:2-polyprenyl-3-methyl-5-hydroxy-6-metoxy-1,4-benzoquinol methylase